MLDTLGKLFMGSPDLASNMASVQPSVGGAAMPGMSQLDMLKEQDAGFESYNIDDIIGSVKSSFNSIDPQKAYKGLSETQPKKEYATLNAVRPQAQQMPMMQPTQPLISQGPSNAMQAIQTGVIGSQPTRDQLIQMFMGGQR